MKNFDTQITQLVNTFVADLTALARAAARATLDSALEGALGRRGGGSRAAVGAPVARVTGGGGRRAKGEKRTAAELVRIQDKVIEFVKDNPGLRIEQINKSLGTSTSDLALPLRKLIADGVFRTEGARRSTKYFPGGGTRSAGGKRGRKKKS